MTEYNFTEEWIPVAELDIDRAVQRSNFDRAKVERFVRNFNPAALGIITVSRRSQIEQVIIDGMHRTETVRIVTTNEGKVLCHVFHGLTKAEEAQMFLDLNAGTQPSVLDKFRVSITAENETSLAIEKLVQAYGWTITTGRGNGTIQCVKALERIYKKSVKLEAEPNLLQVGLLCITYAWGMNAQGAQAVILEGIAEVAAEYGDQLDITRLREQLRDYPGGPEGLHTDATTMARLRRGRVTMAVAEQLVDTYNKNLKTRAIHAWRRRS